MADASVSLDLDAKQLYQELQNVTAKFVQFSQQTKSVSVGADGGASGFGEFEKRVEHATDASGGLWRSNHRVATQIGRLAQELTSGGDAITIFGQAAESAERALNLPLGALGGLVAAGAIAIEIGKEFKKMEKSVESARTELGKPFEGGSTGSLTAAFEATAKEVKGLQESRSFTGIAGDLYTNLFKTGKYGTPKTDESLAVEEQSLDRQFAISAAIAKAANDEADARKIGAHESERQGALLEAVEKTREKIAKIQASDLFPDAKRALTKEAQTEGDLAAEKINKKFFEKDVANIESANEANIKASGQDVDVRLAQSKLATAQDEKKRAQTYEEKEAANAKLAIANEEVEHATRVTQAKKDQLALETQIANIVGTADEKRAAQLAGENEELRKHLADAEKRGATDEIAELRPKLAKNVDEQRGFDLKQEEKSFQTREIQIDASQGRGELEEINALTEHIKDNADHIAELQANPLVDNEELAKAEEHLDKLKNSLDEIQEKRALKQKHEAESDEDFSEREAKSSEDAYKSQAEENVRERHLSPKQRRKEEQHKHEVEAEEEHLRRGYGSPKEREHLDPKLAELAREDARRQEKRREETSSDRESAAAEEAFEYKKAHGGEKAQYTGDEVQHIRQKYDLSGEEGNKVDELVRRKFHLDGQDRAADLKKSQVSASEKDTQAAFKRGLDESEVLKKIEKNTQDIGANK